MNIDTNARVASRVVHANDRRDLLAADRTEVVAVLQGLRALATRDHVMTRTQQRVASSVHADGALVVERSARGVVTAAAIATVDVIRVRDCDVAAM